MTLLELSGLTRSGKEKATPEEVASVNPEINLPILSQAVVADIDDGVGQ